MFTPTNVSFNAKLSYTQYVFSRLLHENDFVYILYPILKESND